MGLLHFLLAFAYFHFIVFFHFISDGYCGFDIEMALMLVKVLDCTPKDPWRWKQVLSSCKPTDKSYNNTSFLLIFHFSSFSVFYYSCKKGNHCLSNELK